MSFCKILVCACAWPKIPSNVSFFPMRGQDSQHGDPRWSTGVFFKQHGRAHLRARAQGFGRQGSHPIWEVPQRWAKTWTGWWLVYPSEKYEFVNWDDDSNPIYGKIENDENGNQTTDQWSGSSSSSSPASRSCCQLEINCLRGLQSNILGTWQDPSHLKRGIASDGSRRHLFDVPRFSGRCQHGYVSNLCIQQIINKQILCFFIVLSPFRMILEYPPV